MRKSNIVNNRARKQRNINNNFKRSTVRRSQKKRKNYNMKGGSLKSDGFNVTIT